jgi:membrane protease YdiL (CAAX protease family)
MARDASDPEAERCETDGSVGSDLRTIGLFILFTLLFSAAFWILSIRWRGSTYLARPVQIWRALWSRKLPNLAEVARLQSQLGWRLNSSMNFVPLYVLLISTAGMVAAVARALGEEIGWRGFLTPQLVRRFGSGSGTGITGLIWTAWHIPILVFGTYHSSAPRWLALSCFTAMVVGLSFILAWLRLSSDSVWPCAILHASHNVLIQAVFTTPTADRGTITAYAIDEFGVPLPPSCSSSPSWAGDGTCDRCETTKFI